VTQPRLPGRRAGSGVQRVDWERVRAVAERLIREGSRMWRNLTPEERAELGALLRKSGGNPRRLNKAEARRLGILTAKAVRDGGR